MYLLHFIGQNPQWYSGFSYGNISQRIPPFDVPPEQRRFIISGTQTGGLEQLTSAHYTRILACRPAYNQVDAEGPVLPSSESLTHGALYVLDDGLRFVMHAHSPQIWYHATALGIPQTRADVTYGSPEMATEMKRLYQEPGVRDGGIIAMPGHQDGIISFGLTAQEAGSVLLNTFAQALQYPA
jgi:ribulose-5-phosphate 4-epimerase/fuculose-1-phosphate aldolase